MDDFKEIKNNKNKTKDRIITFFLDYDTNIVKFLKEYYPQFIAIVAFMFIFTLTNDLNRHLNQDRIRHDTIVSTLSDENEEVLSVLEGDSFLVGDEQYHEHLVHGSEKTYLYYYSDRNTSPSYIYDTSEHEWVNETPAIAFIVYKGFEELGLGTPLTYDGEIVKAETDEYSVSARNYKIDVEDVGSYYLSPILPRRVEKFVEDYSNERFEDMEILNIFRMDNYELIYLKGKEQTYQLRSYMDKTAQMAEVYEGHEFININNN